MNIYIQGYKKGDLVLYSIRYTDVYEGENYQYEDRLFSDINSFAQMLNDVNMETIFHIDYVNNTQKMCSSSSPISKIKIAIESIKIIFDSITKNDIINNRINIHNACFGYLNITMYNNFRFTRKNLLNFIRFSFQDYATGPFKYGDVLSSSVDGVILRGSINYIEAIDDLTLKKIIQ